MTPPDTPTRSDSVTSTKVGLKQGLPDASGLPAPTRGVLRDGLVEFDARYADYAVIKDKKLGAGRFSEVYLACKIGGAIPHAADRTTDKTAVSLKSEHAVQGSMPAIFAVKMAVDKQSIKTLRGEARVLSHLCTRAGCDDYLVPFHGLDIRRNSLVFSALPSTLADLTTMELESLSPALRATKLSDVFLHIARSLTVGLAWMHGLSVVHSDIKPPNILLRPNVSVTVPLPSGQRMLDLPFTPLYADFTSSFLLTDDPKAISSVGGGTYDYMAPEQLTAPFPLPTFKMDVYGLAITLLQLLTGSSPFQNAGANRHAKMAMIKEGKAMQWAMRESIGKARLEMVAKMVLEKDAMDLKALLELGLRKTPDERLTAEQWSRLW
jgi:serine/threonine protein kinase